MDTFTFLIASARKNGNSEQLAKVAARPLAANCNQTWLNLRDFPLPPFQDLRHSNKEYTAPEGNARKLCDATLTCTDLVFVTPVYWYSVPAPLKLYLDYWSHWMRVENLDFKTRMNGKRLWVIAASAGAANEAEPMLAALRLSAKYMGMQWSSHVLGNGTAEGDVLNDKQALATAQNLFSRLAQKIQ